MKTALTAFFFSFSSVLFAQLSFVTCDETHYKQYLDKLSYAAEKCVVELYTPQRFHELPVKDTNLIRKIKAQLAIQAGAVFYDQLHLKAIIQSKPAATCNYIKYTFLYYFKIDSTFDYRFTVAYDEEANLVGDPGFPSIREQPGFYKLAPICNSLESLVSDSTFVHFYPKPGRGTIKTIQLEYDAQVKNLVYKIYGVTQYHGKFGINEKTVGWWYGKIIVANAQTGEKIRVDDYKEYKFFK